MLKHNILKGLCCMGIMWALSTGVAVAATVVQSTEDANTTGAARGMPTAEATNIENALPEPKEKSAMQGSHTTDDVKVSPDAGNTYNKTDAKKCLTVCDRWGESCSVNAQTGNRECRRVCQSLVEECT